MSGYLRINRSSDTQRRVPIVEVVIDDANVVATRRPSHRTGFLGRGKRRHSK